MNVFVVIDDENIDSIWTHLDKSINRANNLGSNKETQKEVRVEEWPADGIVTQYNKLFIYKPGAI